MNLNKCVMGFSVCAMTIFSLSSIANDVIPLSQNDTSLNVLKYSNKYSFTSSKEMISSESVIDVVVFYQPSFLGKWGGQKTYSRIHQWMNEANMALSNSNINARYNIVKVSPTFNIPDELQYDDIKNEDGSYTDGAGYLFSTYVLNEYEGHTEYDLYNKYGGDVVLYVRDYQGELYEGKSPVKGYAGIGGQLATIFDWQAYDQSEPDAAGRTLAHEFGHVLGGNHERATNAFPAHQKSYAAAYKCNGLGTALWSSSSLVNHLFYSDPTREVGGEKCGVEIGQSDEADNTSVIKENAPIAASRRDSVESLGTVSFEQEFVTVDKLSSTVSVELKRTGSLENSANVEVYAIDGTATYGDAFEEAFVEVEFLPGESTAVASFTLLDNSDVETSESFSLMMRYPYKLAPSGSSIVTIGTLSSAVTGDFSFGEVKASEQLQEACVEILRNNGSEGDVVFSLTTENGTATDADYALDQRVITFADGETSKELCALVFDDSIDEGEETFNLYLSTPTNVTFEEMTTITIMDNDSEDYAVGSVKFELNAISVNEGDGEIRVNLLREGGTSGEIVVGVAIEYVNATSADITLLNAEVTFLDGESIAEVVLAVTNDTKIESVETVNLTLSGSQPSDLVVDSTPLKISITSDDVQVEASDSNSESSGGGSISYLLLLPLLRLFGKRNQF